MHSGEKIAGSVWLTPEPQILLAPPAVVLGVVIEGEPHPPITHIGPAARAPNDTAEDLVVGIVSAPTCETVFKNYRSVMRNVSGP